ncbi:MAG TPA: C40 family peptidase [Actinomycetota bacterium]|nr:C40 family peptidase [Actinomycetota bacterium]
MYSCVGLLKTVGTSGDITGVTGHRRLTVVICVLAMFSPVLSGARALTSAVPSWVKPAVKYLDANGFYDRSDFRPNRPMTRSAFRGLMREAFGPGYFKRSSGKVTAGEVSRSLVKALGMRPIARTLGRASSPDGWRPSRPTYFGSEIVARELGLRRDRPTTEDRFDASAGDVMRQADIAWAVWKAKTSPSTYSAEILRDFAYSTYDAKRRKVIQYAVSLVGTPYVWAGEWPNETPSGYPYGAQVHGGFDCSGFIWYVLHSKNDSYRPVDRPYRGWSLPERSSRDMAAGTKNRLRYREFKPGDIVFFAPRGRKSKASEVYHAGLYLGRGWIIHSSGSRAGVSIARIARGSWWFDQILWGRRLIRT